MKQTLACGSCRVNDQQKLRRSNLLTKLIFKCNSSDWVQKQAFTCGSSRSSQMMDGSVARGAALAPSWPKATSTPTLSSMSQRPAPAGCAAPTSASAALPMRPIHACSLGCSASKACSGSPHAQMELNKQ